MRTKTLLLTAALSAAGLATSMAQVYSVNAVGYVNVTVNPGYAILGNPLNGTNNSVNTIMPLPDGSDGATIFRFDLASQSYLDAIQFITGFGWFSPSDPDPTLNPGEGIFFFNPLPTALNLTFVGEVPSGTLNTAVATGNRYSIKSSQVPRTLRLGDTANPATHGFPADDGDTVFVFDNATQAYKDAYQYIAGFGWFSPSDAAAVPDGPEIGPAQGFFIQKIGNSGTWTQTFSVN